MLDDNNSILVLYINKKRGYRLILCTIMSCLINAWFGLGLVWVWCGFGLVWSVYVCVCVCVCVCMSVYVCV